MHLRHSLCSPPLSSLLRNRSLLVAATVVGLLSAPLYTQAVQITECVEVPTSIVSTSARRISTRSDCTVAGALNKARDQSRVNARDALAGTCRDRISTAEADEICRDASGSLPSGATQLSNPPIPVSGTTAIDRALPVSQNAPKICVVLRDLPDETSRTSEDDFGCWLIGQGKKNIVTFASRARCGVQCFVTHQHVLDVRRFTDVALTNAEAEQIVNDMTSVLQTSDGSSDVACSVTFSRVGGVTSFGQGDGSIDSAAEFNVVDGLAGNVKVVEEINFCGTFDPNFSGCSKAGVSLTVERAGPALEGILWAHELGHTRGLQHRNSETAIMNPSVGSNRRQVNTSECSAFRDVFLNTFAASLAPQPASLPGESQPQPPIQDFVRQLFVEGVPYATARSYGPRVVPELLRMLADPREEEHWANVVTVLGIIGDPSAIAPLVSFIEEAKTTRLSRAHHRAKKAAIMALGYLAGAPGGSRALAYLKESLDPDVWAKRGVTGLGPYHVSANDRDLAYSKYAVMGLALSGHAEAALALKELARGAITRSQAQLRDREAALIGFALEEHKKVVEQGLAGYYRTRK